MGKKKSHCIHNGKESKGELPSWVEQYCCWCWERRNQHRYAYEEREANGHGPHFSKERIIVSASFVWEDACQRTKAGTEVVHAR